MEFLSLSRRRSSARNVPVAKSAEKQMFSQATSITAVVNLAYIELIYPKLT